MNDLEQSSAKTIDSFPVYLYLESSQSSVRTQWTVIDKPPNTRKTNGHVFRVRAWKCRSTNRPEMCQFSVSSGQLERNWISRVRS